MANKAKVDVIIPSFRDIRIFRTIKSVFQNRFADDFRLIVVDGGSGDEFVQKVQSKLRSSDIIRSEPDNGIFDALNKGLDLADNEFIYWLGSDDFVNPEFDFEKAIGAFSTDVVGVVGKTDFFDESGITRTLFYKDISYKSYKYGSHVPHFSSIWRREAIGDLRFDLNYRISADYDFFFRLLEKHKRKNVVSLTDTMVYMQEGGNSTKDINQRLKGTRDLFRIHRNHTNLLNAVYFLIARYTIKIFQNKSRFSRKNHHIITHLSQLID